MRTTKVIDDELIKKGMKNTGIKMKTKRVDVVLQKLYNRKARKKILALKGKLLWEDNLDEMRICRFYK
jgi:Arc/MetJ family transcription regulator